MWNHILAGGKPISYEFRFFFFLQESLSGKYVPIYVVRIVCRYIMSGRGISLVTKFVKRYQLCVLCNIIR
jgi:hypothetical protein